MKVKIFIFCVVITVLVGTAWYYMTTSKEQFTNATLVKIVKQVNEL